MKKNNVMVLMLSLMFLPSFTMQKHKLDKNEQVTISFTVNSVGGTEQYYTPLQKTSSEKELSPLGTIFRGVYTTGTTVAILTGITLQNYGIITTMANLGWNPYITLAATLGTNVATLLGASAVAYGGYRIIRPCLTTSESNEHEDDIV